MPWWGWLLATIAAVLLANYIGTAFLAALFRDED